MTHLKVEQNTGTIELVDKSVIAELYELLAYNVLDSSSNLLGRIHTSATYLEYIDYIRAKYPDLYITSDNIYIKFADDAVENVLKNSIGDGIGVTLALALSATYSTIQNLFNNNTNITLFDELRFFTSITLLPIFNGCTNLQHIQIPPSLTQIRYNLLNNCTSLTSIGDTSNLLAFYPNNSYSFTALRLDPTKLQNLAGVFSSQNCPLFNSNESVTISAPNLTTLSLGRFGGLELIITSPVTNASATYCPNLTRVVLPETCKVLDGTGFRNSPNLSSINLENVEEFVLESFISTSITAANLSSLRFAGNLVFANLQNLVITLPNNSWEKRGNVTNAMTMFNRTTFSSITNLEVLANYDYIIREFPLFGNNSPIVDVLNYAKATAFYSSNVNVLEGLSASDSSKYVRLWYSPKLISTFNYSLGTSPYQRFNGSPNKKFFCKLIYLKDITSFSDRTFGGLECEALVINNSTPPTAPITYYADLNEYGNLHLRGVNIDTWGNFEDAQNPSVPFSYLTISTETENLVALNKIASCPSITAIYVPDSAVNTYKTTTGWTSVADKIYPISDLTRYATRATWEAAGKPNVALIEEYM